MRLPSINVTNRVIGGGCASLMHTTAQNDSATQGRAIPKVREFVFIIFSYRYNLQYIITQVIIMPQIYIWWWWWWWW